MTNNREGSCYWVPSKSKNPTVKRRLKYLIQLFIYFFHSFSGLPHETVAKLIAECFAKRDRNTLTMIVMDQKLTPAELRRSFMQPQCWIHITTCRTLTTYWIIDNLTAVFRAKPRKKNRFDKLHVIWDVFLQDWRLPIYFVPKLTYLLSSLLPYIVE